MVYPSIRLLRPLWPSERTFYIENMNVYRTCQLYVKFLTQVMHIWTNELVVIQVKCSLLRLSKWCSSGLFRAAGVIRADEESFLWLHGRLIQSMRSAWPFHVFWQYTTSERSAWSLWPLVQRILGISFHVQATKNHIKYFKNIHWYKKTVIMAASLFVVLVG